MITFLLQCLLLAYYVFAEPNCALINLTVWSKLFRGIIKGQLRPPDSAKNTFRLILCSNLVLKMINAVFVFPPVETEVNKWRC